MGVPVADAKAARSVWTVAGALVVVAATAVLVPRLLPGDGRGPGLAAPTPGPGSSPPQVTVTREVIKEVTVLPSAPPSPSARPAPSSPSPRPSPSPSSKKPKPKPKPTFERIRIAATDPGNEFFETENIDCPTCTSGSRVQYLGQHHAVIVNVRDVPVAGRRTMTIVYESDGPRPLDIAVNDDPTVTLKLAGAGDWVTPARTSIEIDLPAGDSKIKFFHADPAPDLDLIIIE